MSHTLEQLRSGELQGIKRLNLAAGMSEFPEEIFSLADAQGLATSEAADRLAEQRFTAPEKQEAA